VHVSPKSHVPISMPQFQPKANTNAKRSYSEDLVVRSPQKLTDLLTKRELPNDIIVGRLMVVQGNAKDPEAVRKTLVDESGVGAEQIVFRTGES